MDIRLRYLQIYTILKQGAENNSEKPSLRYLQIYTILKRKDRMKLNWKRLRYLQIYTILKLLISMIAVNLV